MKTSRLFFVQRSMYDLLLSKSFTLEDLIGILTYQQTGKKITPITEELISQVNSRVSYVFFNNSYGPDIRAPSDSSYKYDELSERELNYIKDEVINYLVLDNHEHYITDTEDSVKCYEIVTSSTADTVYTVVVVEKGFLSLVTTNPETLTSVYRELIRHLFGNESVNFDLNREYLGLKMNPGNFDLVKLRADKRN